MSKAWILAQELAEERRERRDTTIAWCFAIAVGLVWLALLWKGHKAREQQLILRQGGIVIMAPNRPELTDKDWRGI